MANPVPITNLPLATGLTGEEIVPIVQAGVNKTATTAQLAVASVIATGGTAARTLADHFGIYLSVYDFGYVDGDNIAIAINAATAAASALGGLAIHVPTGTHTISTTIVPQSYCPIIGDGPRLTRFQVETDAPYAQTSGTQVVCAGIIGASFIAGTGHDDATVISLTAAQQCVFSNLRFYNFTTGTILAVTGAVVSSSLEPAVNPATSSNTIFNVFENWVTLGSVGTGIQLMGHYGTTPTGSPASSANVPDVVVTANVYRNLTFWAVQNKGIDIVGACDTEFFDGILINLAGNNSIGVDIASDATFTGNNYVSGHRGSFVFSKNGTPTGVTLIKLNWTFGNNFTVEHDIDTSTITTINDVNSQSHVINGTRLSGVSNLLMETYTKGYTAATKSGSAAVIRSQRIDSHGIAAVAQFAGSGMNAASAATDYGRVDIYCITNSSISAEGQVRIAAPVTNTMTDHAWFYRGAFGIRDGITAPTSAAGIAWIYVDTTDGDLKVKFNDGVIKTLATNP